MPNESPDKSPVGDPEDLELDLALALNMADEADKISLSRWGASDLRVESKPDLTPVTEADKGVEHLIRQMLGERRPTDRIIGEEFGGAESALPAGRTWVIDPIDATANYVRRVPVWATLICLMLDGDPILGVVSAPGLGRRWWALKDSGAWVSEFGRSARRIEVSAVGSLSHASFSYSDDVGWAELGADRGLDHLRSECWRSRAYGDFYSHLLVAEGAVDVAAEPCLKIWDMAAVVAIVRESGGRATSFDGGEPLLAGCLVTSNGILHDALLATLAS
ncbi:MAG: inositol monophosphatase family protein [Candidatus Nanopelagicales bacterium]|nr:inositol monophosphatase family protein [Candidatus Nanopelagicales bacterium]